MNQGDQLVDPYEVSVENNFSLYAGLKILETTLQAIEVHEKDLHPADKVKINETLRLCKSMINGGIIDNNRSTAGLLSFFRHSAWRNGGFVQGGRADDPNGAGTWQPNLQIQAVDVNTWGIAALRPALIDEWFGFGAAYKNWQQIKGWGGYGFDKTLWGVGFSDQDGNGIDADGKYRQGVLSTEWSAGAIIMLRSMIDYYQTLPPDSLHHSEARRFSASLKADERSMLAALENMRIDTYARTHFPGQPQNYSRLQPLGQTLPYLYASKRYMIPFGWYANPIPSTCATAWMIMVAANFNPFVYGGR